MRTQQSGAVRHRRITAGIFIALIAIIGAGCNSTTKSSVVTPSKVTPATGPGSEYAKILSKATRLGTGPDANIVPVHSFAAGGVKVLHVTNATVKVSGANGLLATSKTGRFGVAIVPLNKPPKAMVVSVSGGDINEKPFDGILRAELTNYVAPQPVCVNVLTTIIADIQLANPKVTLALATSKVRRLFDIPSWYDVGCDTQSNGYFDGDLFLADAKKIGGFQKFVDRSIVLMNARPDLITDEFRRLPKSDSHHLAPLPAATTPAKTQRVPVSTKTDAALTAFLTASDSGSSVTSGIAFIFESLERIPATSSLAFLEPFGVWGAVGLGVYSVVSALAGGGSGPTTAQLLSTLQSDFTTLQTAITNVQGTLNNIDVALSALTTQSYEENLKTVETIVNPLVASAQSNMATLHVLDAEAAQITCGDFSNNSGSGSTSGASGNSGVSGTTPPITCGSEAIQQICPSSTVLTWNVETSQVAYPPGYEPSLPANASSLAQNCQSYFTEVFGEGGFIATMNSDGLGSSSSSSLTTLASDLVELPGGQGGILQDTSQWMVSQSRFVDTNESALVQAVFDYYLAVFEEMTLDVLAYDGLTGEPAVNVHNNFLNVPTMATIQSYDPTTVPADEVLDTQTGLLWSQDLGANLSCEELVSVGNVGVCPGTPRAAVGFYGTPSSISGLITSNGSQAQEITPAASSGLPTLAENVTGPGNYGTNGLSVALINPLSYSPSNSSGTLSENWYAAGEQQLTTLNPSTSPPGSDTDGDELKIAPEQLNGGAGFAPSVFGYSNGGISPGYAYGGLDDPTSTNTYQYVGLDGFCSNSNDCFQATIGNGLQTCTITGNTSCATPSYNNVTTGNQGGFWDLNNFGSNNGVGAFSGVVQVTNWLDTQTYCDDVSSWSHDCESNATEVYSSTFNQIDSNGWVTLFYRSPIVSSSGPSECYFYAPSGATLQSGSYTAPGATQGAAVCPVTPNAYGYNGLYSQAPIPASS